MIISEERQSHLARLIVDRIWDDDLVDFSDDDLALRLAKGLVRFVQEGVEIDKATRQKIASLKRGVVDGSPEWDVLYGKYYEEEMQRRGTK